VLTSIRGQVAVRNTIAIQPNSVILGNLSNDLLTRLQSDDGILYFNHRYGVTRSSYETSHYLSSFWKVDAFTTSSYSDEFVSMFSARDYPFYCIHFYLEKNLF
jgi:methenyltetrahydromethanopterin cyclohydrolase